MFVEQADIHDIRLEQANRSSVYSSLEFSKARVAIGEKIRALDYCYRGTLIPGLVEGSIAQTQQWIAFLLSFKKPVVFFDRHNLQFNPYHHHKTFYHMHIDEAGAVDKALSFLAAKDHVVAAYLYNETEPWQLQRGALIKSRAAHYGIDVSMHGWSFPEIEKDSAWWVNSYKRLKKIQCKPLKRRIELMAQGCIEYRDRLRQLGFNADHMDYLASMLLAAKFSPQTANSAMQPLPSALKETVDFLRQAIIAAPILENRSLTALIAPSDKAGRKYIQILKTCGYQIPRDLSVIGFDNWFRYSFYQLTTVDFGFSSLGYKAFHAIMGDTLAVACISRKMPGEPRIVDNGSVADCSRDFPLQTKT